MRMRGRNSFSITALVVSAIYIGLAVTTHFVLLGIVPLFSAVRALRRREPLAPVALVAAILVIVVAVLTIR